MTLFGTEWVHDTSKGTLRFGTVRSRVGVAIAIRVLETRRGAFLFSYFCSAELVESSSSDIPEKSEFRV